MFFKHSHSNTEYFASHNHLSFKIIDKANSKFDLKIKEDLHINPLPTNVPLTQKPVN